MKKLSFLLIVICINLLIVSCKKEHVPVTTIGTPIFYFNGTVNGVATDLNAGINNYYMYSSYTQDSSNVYNFIGNIKQTNSNLTSIEIDINDYKVSAVNSSTNPDSSLKPGNYSYYSVGINDTAYNVQFNSSYTNGTAQTYTWNFGDGTTSNSANPLHSYASLGNYNVCLTIAGSSGVSTICNNISVSSPSVTVKKTTVSSFSTTDTVFFSTLTTGFIPYKYTWSFGDGTPADTVFNTNTVAHTYTPSLYHVSLTIVDSMGANSITTNYNAAPATYSVGVANYTFSNPTQVITTGSLLRLSNVTVKWTDASGVVYTSNNNATQPSTSYFKILSEEAYQNNINGQLTRKLHVQFTCTLYSAGHPSIQITNADAIIAVAYK